MTRLNGFDGMRAIACLAVLFHHLMQRLGIDSPVRYPADLAEAGVSLFFVLSGALLSYPFWRAYLQDKPLPNVKHYALHRAARIVPAFYLVLLISVFVSAQTGTSEYTMPRMVAGLLFLAPYHYISFFPADLNGPLWSIGLEVSCYVLLPLFLIATWWLGNRRWWKAALVVIIGVLFLQWLNPWVVETFLTDAQNRGWQYGIIGGAKQWLPYWNVVSFMGQFLCGSLAALAIAATSQRPMNKFQPAFDVLAILSLFAAIYVIATFGQSGQPSRITQQPYFAPYFAFLCALTLFALSQSRWLYRLFDNPLFKKIATLSFGLYLWHMLIIESMAQFWVYDFYYHGVNDFWRWFGLSCAVVILSTLIAALSYRYFEKPILNWARQWTTNH